MLRNQLKRKLAACVAAALSATCLLCAVPADAMGTRDDAPGVVLENIAYGKNYTTNMEPNTSYPDSSNELTDEIRGGLSYKEASWVGFYGHDLEVVMDLGEDTSFCSVSAGFLNDKSSGIYSPHTVTVSYSNDGNSWTLFSEGTDLNSAIVSPAVLNYDSGTQDTVTARYVKVRAQNHSYDPWLFIDEIAVYAPVEGEMCELPVITQDLSTSVSLDLGQPLELSIQAESPDGGTLSYQWYKDGVKIDCDQATYSVPAADLTDGGIYSAYIINSKAGFASSKKKTASCVVTVSEPADVDPNNLAAGKTYTSSIEASPTYSDTVPGTKLTDSHVGSLVYSDGFWVGYNAHNVDIVVDLEETVSFGQVEMNFYTNGAAGIQGPSQVKVSYSDDGLSWTELSNDGMSSGGSGASITTHLCFAYTETGLVSGRYIKVEAASSGSWIFIDEIKVLGVPAPFPGGQDTFEPDPNNLAYGCGYTSAWQSNSSYADRTGGMLTDGACAPAYFRAPQWVGYLTSDGEKEGLTDFYVTVDLGSNRNFEQVVTGVLRESGPSIKNPTHIKVEYSTDEKNWNVLADEDTAFEDGDRVNRFAATASAPVSGRYVRIHYTASGWIFLDEIEVLAQALPSEGSVISPDNGREVNLVRGNTNYVLSPSPKFGNRSGILTDGYYSADFTANDPYWVGFAYDKSLDNHVVMEFDLAAANSISKIILSSRYDPDNNLTVPKNLTLSISDHMDNWTEIKVFPDMQPAEASLVEIVWDSNVDTFRPAERGATKLYTKKVRLEFDIPEGDDIVCFDEVKIMGKFGKCSDASEAITILDETGTYNLALYAPYVTTPATVPNEVYTDNGRKLTDGVSATGNYSDPAWVGYSHQDIPIGETDSRAAYPVKSFTVDLQEIKTIKSISFNMCVNGSAAIREPSSTVYVSADGENWVTLCKEVTPIGTLQSGIYTYGWNVPKANDAVIRKTYVEDEMIAARYVRVSVELFGWTFIDEIFIPGYDGQLEGVRLADFGTDIDGTNYQTADGAGGVGDMILCYNQWSGYEEESETYGSTYTPEKLRYLLTYVNDNNQVVDTMYDTVLFLALNTRYGRNFIQPTGKEEFSNADDWEWYLGKMFATGGDVEMLNAAAKQASIDLNDPDYKVNMVIMYPGVRRSNFGKLDGHTIDYTKKEDRDYALHWWIEKVLEGLEKVEHEYITFKGFYWLHESASGDIEDMLYFNEAVHEKGYYTYWIPYYNSTGHFHGEAYGFDGVCYQPNHMFYSPYEKGGDGELVENGNGRFKSFYQQLNYAKMGPEMELDGRIWSGDHGEYNKWLDYLNAAVDYGYDGPGIHRAWYYADPLIATANSAEPVIRNAYNYAYQVIKGTYTRKEYVTADDMPRDPAIGEFTNYGGVYGSGSTGGGGSSGGGSTGGGGGNLPSNPDDGKDPVTPATGDDNYTWEETDDGYQLTDKDGEIVTGWAKVDGKWYYLNDNGIRQTGWQKVDNNWYYLKEDGVMATGWLKLGNVWYFLNGGGVMQTGWLQDGGVWYYLYDWGGMANDRWVQVGNTWYYFRGNGAMATGWNWVGSKCYYFYSSGKMAANTTVGGYKLDASGVWVK